jgi:RNA polymerase sigma factor (TIGR02999 family)
MKATEGITDLLLQCRGDRSAVDRVFPVIYDELRRVAHRQLRKERPGHTLDSTALVHEAYIRMVDVTRVEWQDRVHFLSMAARAMRRILVDHARAHRAARRGGGAAAESLDDALVAADAQAEELTLLDDALEELATVSPRFVQVVEYRFFAGMTEDEVAEVLGVTTRTVRRDWVKARALLRRALDDPPATA